MKDYEPLGHPDASIVPPAGEALKDSASADPNAPITLPGCGVSAKCLACGEPLLGRQRKVHAGACARKREIELQRRRRQRRR